MVIFFLRSYNDVDHIVPVIDKWASTIDKKIKVVITEIAFPYWEDYRFQYLQRKHGIVPVSILEFCPLPSFLKHLLSDIILAPGMNGAKRFNLFGKILKKIITKFLVEKATVARFQIDFDEMLDTLMNGSSQGGVLVFDHHMNDLSNWIINHGKKRGFKAIALPHAVDNWDNILYQITDMDIRISNQRFSSWNLYDKIIFPDKYSVEKCCLQGVDKSHVKIVGSARFAAEWMRKLDDEVLPKYDLPKVGDHVLKIVYFLTKPKNGVFQDEVLRVIEYVSRFPNVFLIVKLHTRGMPFPRRDLGENCLIEDNNIPSGVLIDWADLSLFTATSVILDSLRKDKPVLYLRKTVCNKLIFERFITSWDVECRDQLQEWLWKFIENKNTRTYSREDADRCLRELTGSDSEHVLEQYVQEIRSLMGNR